MVLRILNRVIREIGYKIVKGASPRQEYKDIKDEDFWEIYECCKAYSMTSVDRFYALYNAVNYIIDNDIKGDFVECGVWRGGSSMIIALILKKRGDHTRKIYMYDTFEGMSEPTNYDVDLDGSSAVKQLSATAHKKETSVWCLASYEDVERNISTTGFPMENIKMIKGKVEDTTPENLPDMISLLRLDTDWYESTKHELTHLYPLLSTNGVMIIDDYGHWEGCRRAVDEYFIGLQERLFLNRIDYTGRIGIKFAV